MDSINVALVGDGFVGKTALILKILGSYQGESLVPSGFNSGPYYGPYGLARVLFWEAPSDMQFHLQRSEIYQRADIILVCFDVSQKSSFDNVYSFWISEVEAQKKISSKSVFLLGLKSDGRNRPLEQRIDSRNALELVNKHSSSIKDYFECSPLCDFQGDIDGLLQQILHLHLGGTFFKIYSDFYQKIQQFKSLILCDDDDEEFKSRLQNIGANYEKRDLDKVVELKPYIPKILLKLKHIKILEEDTFARKLVIKYSEAFWDIIKNEPMLLRLQTHQDILRHVFESIPTDELYNVLAQEDIEDNNFFHNLATDQFIGVICYLDNKFGEANTTIAKLMLVKNNKGCSPIMLAFESNFEIANLYWILCRSAHVKEPSVLPLLKVYKRLLVSFL